MMCFIKGFWYGERRLWQAFWFVFVLGYFTLFIVTTNICIALDEILATSILGVINLVSYFSFLVYASIATWRCSKNTNWFIWTWLAKLVIVLVILKNI